MARGFDKRRWVLLPGFLRERSKKMPPQLWAVADLMDEAAEAIEGLMERNGNEREDND